jgi:hypothetical protein
MKRHPVDTQTINNSLRFLEKVCARGVDEDALLLAIYNLRKALTTPLNTEGNKAVILSTANVSA